MNFLELSIYLPKFENKNNNIIYLSSMCWDVHIKRISSFRILCWACQHSLVKLRKRCLFCHRCTWWPHRANCCWSTGCHCSTLWSIWWQTNALSHWCALRASLKCLWSLRSRLNLSREESSLTWIRELLFRERKIRLRNLFG